MYVDIWYDRASKTWYASLINDEGLQVGDSVNGYTIDDAVKAAQIEGWDEYEMYKDVQVNGFKKPL